MGKRKDRGVFAKIMLNFLIFIVILSVLIISHELGHFIAARLSKIKVEKFAIGFGPPLIKFKVKETYILICLIPLGGYVKLAGDTKSEHKGFDYEFLSKPCGVKARVVLFGPLFNYLLAFLIFWGIFVLGCPYPTTLVGKVLDGYPAKTAGIREGDRILEVNGEKVDNWLQLQEKIKKSKDKVVFTILRGGEIVKIKVVPTKEKMQDILGRKRERVVVGISASSEVKIVRENFIVAFFKGGGRVVYLTWLVIQGLFLTITGRVPLKEAVAGPVGIYYITQQTAKLGGIALLNLMGILSVTLAVINLFPVPVLDGGHLFFFLIEKIRGKPMSEKWENLITQIGLALIISLAVFVFYNDIIRFGPKILGR